MEDLDVSFTGELVYDGGNWASGVGTVWWRPSCVVFVQISVSLNKDEPETPLTILMRTKGAEKIREALGSYVGFLKTGEWKRSRSQRNNQ